MPQYAAIIYSRDVDWTAPEQAGGHGRVRTSSARPRPPSCVAAPRSTRPRRATTVRVTARRAARSSTSDGPYAETKEVLTGFYLLECADLDEAIAWAAQIPGGLGRSGRGAPGHRLRRC